MISLVNFATTLIKMDKLAKWYKKKLDTAKDTITMEHVKNALANTIYKIMNVWKLRWTIVLN